MKIFNYFFIFTVLFLCCGYNSTLEEKLEAKEIDFEDFYRGAGVTPKSIFWGWDIAIENYFIESSKKDITRIERLQKSIMERQHEAFYCIQQKDDKCLMFALDEMDKSMNKYISMRNINPEIEAKTKNSASFLKEIETMYNSISILQNGAKNETNLLMEENKKIIFRLV